MNRNMSSCDISARNLLLFAVNSFHKATQYVLPVETHFGCCQISTSMLLSSVTQRIQMESAASRKRCADDDGISAESLSKCKSSASSTSAHSNRHDIDVCDKEQDSDTEQVDMVCDM